jgi:cytoskeletal protein CcmA (bactofilin family)
MQIRMDTHKKIYMHEAGIDKVRKIKTFESKVPINVRMHGRIFQNIKCPDINPESGVRISGVFRNKG